MSDSQKSPKPQAPPLNRWKGRLRIFHKPTVWISTSVLLLIGLSIADYSQNKVNQGDIETQLELANERVDDGNSKGDRQDSLPISEYEADYSDAPQPATLDGIPLPDDPEQREWAIREANDLNLELDSVSQDALEKDNQDPSLGNENTLNDAFSLSASARPIIHARNTGGSQKNASAAFAPHRYSQNYQDSQSDSRSLDFAGLSGYINNTDTVLALMGLDRPRALDRSLETPSLDVAPSSVDDAVDWFSNSDETMSLPPSALAQALQTVALESVSQSRIQSLGDPPPSERSPQIANLDAYRLSLQSTGQSLDSPEGVPIFQPPSVQTAPLPGTTGYIAPSPLPIPMVSGSGALSNPAGITLSPAIGASASYPTIAPQPTVISPSQPLPAVPSPVFAAPVQVEPTPYAGGGRNGEINTFSNP